MLAFREEQASELAATCGCGKGLGDFTTMNLTMVSGQRLWGGFAPLEPLHLCFSQLKAGSLDQHQFNVIPTVAEAGFDCRIPATVDLDAFKRRLDEWCSEDPGVTYELVGGTDTRATQHAVSDISEGSHWWGVFQAATVKVSEVATCYMQRFHNDRFTMMHTDSFHPLSPTRLASNFIPRQSFPQQPILAGFASY